MKVSRRFILIKKLGAICGLLFGMIISGQALAECELEEGYELPSGFEFDGYCNFNEGLAPVAKEGKYGFINKQGKIVIPLKYEYADSFFEGVSQVKKYSKYGFINKYDEVVIPLEHDKVTEVY